jgi:hypothetical protein
MISHEERLERDSCIGEVTQTGYVVCRRIATPYPLTA